MPRYLLAGLLLLGAGCSMGQNPYDYAGPTLAPNGQPIGGFNNRAGSIYNGMNGPVYNAPQSPTPAVPPVGVPSAPPLRQAPPPASYNTMPTSYNTMPAATTTGVPRSSTGSMSPLGDVPNPGGN